MQIILLGPPGVGKGTQADKLRQHLRVPQISTGEMLRHAVRTRTELGKVAQGYMERGALVPDQVMVSMIGERLGASDAGEGFILDGFPRTVEQAQALKELLGKMDMPIDHVLCLKADDRVVVKRISGRRTCRACGALFHMHFQPPRQAARCDQCGGELEQRADDQEETVRERLAVYRQKTEPLVAYYAREGLLREIQGDQEVGNVFEQILEALKAGKGH